MYIKTNKDMNKKILDTLNFCRSELKKETNPKMDKDFNYGKIVLLTKIIDKLK